MIERAQIADWLQTYYRLGNVTVEPLHAGSEDEKQLFTVKREIEHRYAVQAFTPQNTRSDPAALAQVLLLLEEADYPAERLIRAENRSPVVEVDGWRLIVTSYVDGRPAEPNADTVRGVGELLGRLHRIDRPGLRYLPEAERTMTQQLRQAREHLKLAESNLTDEQCETFERLKRIIASIRPCDNLPHVLAHNDFHLENIVVPSTSQLKVIDWGGAGRGPALLDIGFLLGSVHPKESSDPDLIGALVEGYRKQRKLSPQELACLPDAVKFRTVEHLSRDLLTLSEGREVEEHDWWLARLNSADETAAIARDHFES